jgi:hypothetical protein
MNNLRLFRIVTMNSPCTMNIYANKHEKTVSNELLFREYYPETSFFLRMPLLNPSDFSLSLDAVTLSLLPTVL